MYQKRRRKKKRHKKRGFSFVKITWLSIFLFLWEVFMSLILAVLMGHDIQESEKEEFGKKGNGARVGEGRKKNIVCIWQLEESWKWREQQ